MKALLAHLIAPVVLMLAASTGHAQTINWSSLTQSTIVDSQGNPLDGTYVFELGAFNASFVPTDANLAQWAANWHAFDTGAYAYDPPTGSYFTGSESAQNVTNYPSIFEGMAAFVWIRNTTFTETFLASAGPQTGPPATAAWVFPALDPGCCPNGEVTTWSVSNFGGDTPTYGSQLGNDSSGVFVPSTGSPYDIQLHVVPEPSALVLIATFSSLILLRRRRF